MQDVALRILGVVGWTLLFTAAFTLSPLYESNQHTKFLAGMAHAGVGHLSEDWLARTADPFPVFTALIEGTVRHLHPWCFHLYASALLGVFLFSMIGISSHLYSNAAIGTRGLYLASLVVLHSKALDELARETIGAPATQLFHAGIADKSILTNYLQPALFGVLLLLSIERFLRHRPIAAALALAAAGVVHPSYLFTAVPIIVAYGLVLLVGDRKPIQAAFIVALAFLPMLPSALYLKASFPPAPPEIHAEAERILVMFRIPHHTLPSVWMGWGAGLQLAWIVLGLVLVWRTRLFPVMGLTFAAALVPTLAQLLTGSLGLAALMPWRNTVLLVPLATAAILASAARWWSRGPAPWRTRAAAALLIIVCGFGAASMRRSYARSERHEAAGLFEYVAKNAGPGETWLVPPSLTEFRLETGQPAFVTRKSHPNRDEEMIEWYRRFRLAEEFYSSAAGERCRRLRTIATREGITHVVTRTSQDLAGCDTVEKLYDDPRFTAYRSVVISNMSTRPGSTLPAASTTDLLGSARVAEIAFLTCTPVVFRTPCAPLPPRVDKG